MSKPATAPSFAAMNLAPPLLQALEDVGYEQPSPIQAEAIPALLEGHDLLGQAQTGTGKTAAFALPLLSRLDLARREPQILVLAPTRELAIQVAEAFQTYARHLKDFHVMPIYGGQSYEVQLRQLKRGVHVVVGTPGRVMDHMRSGKLKLDSLRALVLDEADEMLRMGFIDDVEWVLEQIPATRQIALVAARRAGARCTVAELPFVGADDASLVEGVLSAVTPRTRVAVLDHVTSQTGLVLPLAELVPELEARGIAVIVDGAHAPGMIELDIETLSPSWYTGNCHKWLCAPKASGFLVAATDAPVVPVVTSHGATPAYGPANRLHAELDWNGTYDPGSQFAVTTAIEAVAAEGGGWPAVLARNHALALELRRRWTDGTTHLIFDPVELLARLAALVPRRQLSKPAPGHRIYPYLLRDVPIDRVDQVWSTDITYIRLRRGFAYLVAVIDWYSRYVLAWELAPTLDTEFCMTALETALRQGQPEIFNTDQGAQFTSAVFTGRLEAAGVQISMDGRGRALDNVFVERLWRSVKYEEVYLKDYTGFADAARNLAGYFRFYNGERLHQALGYRTPAVVYRAAA